MELYFSITAFRLRMQLAFKYLLLAIPPQINKCEDFPTLAQQVCSLLVVWLLCGTVTRFSRSQNTKHFQQIQPERGLFDETLCKCGKMIIHLT